MPQIERTYTDLDLNFTKHPITKDVSRKVGEQAIIASVKNLIYTNFYERPFNPKLGSNVRRILFEPLDAITGAILQKEITILINNFEPRVRLEGVQVVANPDSNNFQVTITFFTANSVRPIRATVFLNRLR